MINTYITKEIEQRLSLEDLPEEIKDAVIEGLTENIFKRILLLTATLLTEEEASTFSALTDEGRIEEAFLLVLKTYPDFENLVFQTTQEVINEFTENTNN
jgi:hypothetical protein